MIVLTSNLFHPEVRLSHYFIYFLLLLISCIYINLFLFWYLGIDVRKNVKAVLKLQAAAEKAKKVSLKI